jgi:hypothetical protein
MKYSDTFISQVLLCELDKAETSAAFHKGLEGT